MMGTHSNESFDEDDIIIYTHRVYNSRQPVREHAKSKTMKIESGRPPRAVAAAALEDRSAQKLVDYQLPGVLCSRSHTAGIWTGDCGGGVQNLIMYTITPPYKGRYNSSVRTKWSINFRQRI